MTIVLYDLKNANYEQRKAVENYLRNKGFSTNINDAHSPAIPDTTWFSRAEWEPGKLRTEIEEEFSKLNIDLLALLVIKATAIA